MKANVAVPQAFFGSDKSVYRNQCNFWGKEGLVPIKGFIGGNC
jgi:hypothetical protein